MATVHMTTFDTSPKEKCRPGDFIILDEEIYIIAQLREEKDLCLIRLADGKPLNRHINVYNSTPKEAANGHGAFWNNYDYVRNNEARIRFDIRRPVKD